MSPKKNSKKRVEAESVRSRHLLATVTREDKRQIIKYCTTRKITMSEFLTDISLREARYRGRRARKRISIDLSYAQHAKLDYLATARGVTVQKCIYDLIQPSLDKHRAWNTPKGETLRYYLSEEEHRLVTQYMAKHNLSSRHFVGLLVKRHVAHMKGARDYE